MQERGDRWVVLFPRTAANNRRRNSMEQHESHTYRSFRVPKLLP